MPQMFFLLVQQEDIWHVIQAKKASFSTIPQEPASPLGKSVN